MLACGKQCARPLPGYIVWASWELKRKFQLVRPMPSKAEIFSRSISACIENGKKLLKDANLLFDWDRFSTAFALSVLAQEEFAKAFLLQLVVDDALPWLPEVQRSIARHQCKHLLAIVMEWLPPFDWDHVSEQIGRAHV